MQDPYHETFRTWNKIAGLYEEHFMHLDIYDHTYDLFCETLQQAQAKVLEIGCGPGNIARYLLTKRPDIQLLGIDVAPNMIERARKNNPSARFEVMDVRQINSLENSFNGIICGFCLPYISPDDLEPFIASCARLLQNNGSFYLSFVAGHPDRSGFQTGSSGDRVFFYYYELNRILQLMEQNEFGQLQIMEVPFSRSEKETEIHTIVIGRKKD